MQKEQSVRIDKSVILFLIVYFLSFYSFSQRREIKASKDYVLLNKSIEKYFLSKKKSDSIFFSNAKDFSKDSVQVKIIKRHKERRKKMDTLHIKMIADKIIYGQFLKEDAIWKNKKSYKKYLVELNSIFSKEEVTNYYEQLKSNFYLWDIDKINFKDRVFVNNEMQLTRMEIEKLPKEMKNLKNRKIYDFEKRINLYTFSKPIYSLNKHYALIAYNNRGINILNIFENVNGNCWQLYRSLSNNLIISRVIP